MKRFVILVLASAVAASVLADDLIPAPYRGMSRTTFSEWTYDDPCGVYSFDPPENSWYVSHPDYEDPLPIDPCLPYFSAQRWGGNNDPCLPDWIDTFVGRQGVIDFAFGSWEMNNFTDAWPAKDLWVQVTYFNIENPGEPAQVNSAGAGTDDPCAPPLWFGAELVSSQILDDGWIHDVFAVTIWQKAEYEFFEMAFDQTVLIDQIIIETFPFPEPATMVLLGLGGLLMIRRRR